MKLGQGNKFTGVCLSTPGGGYLAWSRGGMTDPNFWGGVSDPNFWGGGLPQIFWGGSVCSKFSGGEGVWPKFFGGVVSAPNFWGGVCSEIFGGVSAQNFRGGWCLKFFFLFFFSVYFPPKNSSGMHTLPPPHLHPETVNARPVHILLECILVQSCDCLTKFPHCHNVKIHGLSEND